jgi:hypothetical protein
MSLINDALKQAKQAQDSSPSVTTPGLEFRAPSRSGHYSRPGRGLMTPVLIACAVIAIAFGMWKFYPVGAHPAPIVANTPPQIATVAPPTPAAPVVPTPAVAVPVSQPAAVATVATVATVPPVVATSPVVKPPEPKPRETPATEPTATINLAAITPIVPDFEIDTLPNIIVVKPESASAPRAVVAPPAPAVVAPPKPTVPKLQGIVFSPTRPSAMISGRTLFLGDKFGDQKVARIEVDSVTLVSATQTNVMSLTP